MDELEFPPLTEEQLAALSRIYPDKSADLSWSDRDVWYKAGQASVIAYLKRHRDEAIQQQIETPDHVRRQKKKPAIPDVEPTPAPTTPEPTPVAPEAVNTAANQRATKKRGKSALRIDVAMNGGSSAGGVGVNVANG